MHDYFTHSKTLSRNGCNIFWIETDSFNQYLVKIRFKSRVPLFEFNVTVFDFKCGGDFTGLEQEYHKYKDLEDGGYNSFVIADLQNACDTLVALIVEVKERLKYFKNTVGEFNNLGGNAVFAMAIGN